MAGKCVGYGGRVLSRSYVGYGENVVGSRVATEVKNGDGVAFTNVGEFVGFSDLGEIVGRTVSMIVTEANDGEADGIIVAFTCWANRCADAIQQEPLNKST